MRYAILGCLLQLAAACGGDDGDAPGTQPRLLSVGGTYQTAVTLLQSTCQGTQVQTFPTTVTHTPGASTLSLSHAGSTYVGTVSANGALTAPNATHTLGGVSYVIGIQGMFTATAMDATVTVAPQVTPPCHFSARWQGPKNGTPNVIP